jgi:isocitrate lyase
LQSNINIKIQEINKLGGKELVTSREAVNKLVAARLSSDVMGMFSLVIARTYAEAGDLITSDIDPSNIPFPTNERTIEDFYRTRPGFDRAASRELAYCPLSFNWRKNLDADTISCFQRELGAMDYRFQFITFAGFHALNHSMFDLAHGCARNGMSAFVGLQEREFEDASRGFEAVKYQREVGTGYFDAVTATIEANTSIQALKGFTEEQFH